MQSSTEQQTNGNQKRSSHSCFKRAWQAIKRTFTCSGKDKVVPFSSPSDPDPSDLQADPYVQTELRVFKPVAIQDLSEFLPGSCNLEQTPLEHPADPQPGPSGLQSAAPEEPADHQPGQQTKRRKKKKRSRGCFKGACRAINCTFSRSGKNKVVPFSSPSDSDPSDLQEDPSGLQSTAPEKPADKQPEHQTKGNKKKNSSRSCFKRAWRALKGIFSRSRRNKVAPFISPSDPDPSDLQADLFVQTELCVYKPVGPQDLGDFLPSSCICEQTPLEDPADPQPGPSGLQSAAPEVSADPQPGPSGLQSAAPEVSADPQPARSFSSLYEVGYKLGSGCAGTVYEGIRRSDGQKVAIKMIKEVGHFAYNMPGHIMPVFREVALNWQLHKPEKCPHIVEMLDWFEDQQIMILEYPQPCKTLYEFILDHYFGLGETLARDFMRQAAIAATHWIDHGVNHGDIHMWNVLVNTETLQIKFIDFGCGQLITTSDKSAFGYCDRARAVTDTVYRLCDLLSYMLHGLYNVSISLSEECLDLLKWIKSVEPADRPTLDEFMDHKWFKQG